MESINDYISQVLKAVDTDDSEQLDKLKAQGNRLNTTYSEVAEVMLNFISTSNLQLDFIQHTMEKKLEILIKSLYDNKVVTKEQVIEMNTAMDKLEQYLESEMYKNL